MSNIHKENVFGAKRSPYKNFNPNEQQNEDSAPTFINGVLKENVFGKIGIKRRQSSEKTEEQSQIHSEPISSQQRKNNNNIKMLKKLSVYEEIKKIMKFLVPLQFILKKEYLKQKEIKIILLLNNNKLHQKKLLVFPFLKQKEKLMMVNLMMMKKLLMKNQLFLMFFLKKFLVQNQKPMLLLALQLFLKLNQFLLKNH